MGGLHGFGRVELEPDEPVFHARWEARVFGMRILGMLRLATTIDARRHALERLDPVTYPANGYYGRWLASLERELREADVLRPGELEARLAGGAGRGGGPPPPPAAGPA